MYRVELHKRIDQIMKLFYLLRLWHRGDEATVWESRMKWFYSICFFLLPLSLAAGAVLSDSRDESIYLVEAVIITSVLVLKLWYIIWNQKDILELLDRICVYSIDDKSDFSLVKEKQNKLMKYVSALILIAYCTCLCGNVLVPFVGNEKKLMVNIGFPLDYKHNEVGFWIAYAFVCTQAILCLISLLFAIIMWYFMFNCAIKYEILGRQLQNLGVKGTKEMKVETTVNQKIISDADRHKLFHLDLIAAIEAHKHTNELTSQMESFLSYIFLIKIATSALCICGSIYCIIFTVGDNYVEYLMHLGILIYNIGDILMLMYFGNEIKLSSDKLSYCLFESNWVDEPQSTKKCIVIFGERLKQPYEIVVGKLYALTLETFQRILNSAYSMLNILKNLN